MKYLSGCQGQCWICSSAHWAKLLLFYVQVEEHFYVFEEATEVFVEA